MNIWGEKRIVETSGKYTIKMFFHWNRLAYMMYLVNSALGTNIVFFPELSIVPWINHEWFFWNQNAATQNHSAQFKKIIVHSFTHCFHESEPPQTWK